MAQPSVPFHDPNAPYRPQQRQRPTNTSAFNYGPPAPGPHYPTQQPLQPPLQQQQQFYQGAPGSGNGYANQNAGGPNQDFYTPVHRHPAPHSAQPGAGGAPSPANPLQFQPQQNAYAQPRSAPVQTPGFGFAQPQQQQQHQHQVAQQPDFINQFAQNPMAGLAMNTAQEYLNKQSELYLPGAYGVWGSLKYYFTVNNSYVKSRLKILLMPFWHKNWRRIQAPDSDNKLTPYAPPTRDINAPDLYLPLMGFLTYILIVGYSKGTSNQFSPDVIGKDASYCLVMQLMEIGVLAFCLYLLNSSISFLDLVAFSGYKYIPLVINTITFQLLGPLAYYITLLYTGVAVSFFTLNCMKGSVAEPTPENRVFRNYLLFGVSCLQLVLVCWISYTTAPQE